MQNRNLLSNFIIIFVITGYYHQNRNNFNCSVQELIKEEREKRNEKCMEYPKYQNNKHLKLKSIIFVSEGLFCSLQ